MLHTQWVKGEHRLGGSRGGAARAQSKVKPPCVAPQRHRHDLPVWCHISDGVDHCPFPQIPAGPIIAAPRLPSSRVSELAPKGPSPLFTGPRDRCTVPAACTPRARCLGPARPHAHHRLPSAGPALSVHTAPLQHTPAQRPAACRLSSRAPLWRRRSRRWRAPRERASCSPHTPPSPAPRGAMHRCAPAGQGSTCVLERRQAGADARACALARVRAAASRSARCPGMGGAVHARPGAGHPQAQSLPPPSHAWQVGELLRDGALTELGRHLAGQARRPGAHAEREAVLWALAALARRCRTAVQESVTPVGGGCSERA